MKKNSWSYKNINKNANGNTQRMRTVMFYHAVESLQVISPPIHHPPAKHKVNNGNQKMSLEVTRWSHTWSKVTIPLLPQSREWTTTTEVRYLWLKRLNYHYSAYEISFMCFLKRHLKSAKIAKWIWLREELKSLGRLFRLSPSAKFRPGSQGCRFFASHGGPKFTYFRIKNPHHSLCRSYERVMY